MSSYRPVCLEDVIAADSAAVQLKSNFEKNLSWSSWGLNVITSVFLQFVEKYYISLIYKPVRAIKHISPLRSKTSAVYINAKAVEVVSQMITEDLEQTIQKDSSFKTFKMSERVLNALSAIC